MFDWVLNKPHAGNGRKKLIVEKKFIVFRSVFRTQSSIYDGFFLQK